MRPARTLRRTFSTTFERIGESAFVSSPEPDWGITSVAPARVVVNIVVAATGTSTSAAHLRDLRKRCS